MALNDKQKKFCEEYLVDLHATNAAIRAGYSKKTAYSIGQRQLKRDTIQQYIQERQKQLQKKTGITQERVLRELEAIAFSDIRKFYNAEDGSLKNITDLDDQSAAALAGVETEELFGMSGEGKVQIGITKKIKRWDKNKALENIMRHLGMLNDKLTVNASEELVNLYKSVMTRGKR